MLTQNEKRLGPAIPSGTSSLQTCRPPLWCRPSGTRTSKKWGTRSAPSSSRGGQNRSRPCGWRNSRVGLGAVLVMLGQ